MTIDALAETLQAMNWFDTLGTADISAEEWEQSVLQGVRSGFNLSTDAFVASPKLLTLNWLPTTIHDEDPVHGNHLAALAEQLDKAQEFKRARLEISKLTQISLRTMTKHPLSQIGSSDLSEAIRGAALFAFRQAAAEVVTGQQGLWCSLVPIYQRGNWPLGLMPNGTVLVL